MQTRNTTPRSWTTFALLYVLVVAIQCGTWFVLYRFAGYNNTTMTIATASHLVVGLITVAALKLGWARIGLGLGELLRAVVIVVAAHALFLLLGLLLNQFGTQLKLFRDTYRVDAFLNNWVLTGLGEELIFAGVLFTLLRAQPVGRKSWLAVLLVALLFALWHLPAHIAIALSTGNWSIGIVFDLLLNVVSWCFFGAIYLFSRNLWLTAMAHASTDYALLPMTINNPAIGLLFMCALVACAYFLGRRASPHQPGVLAESAT